MEPIKVNSATAQMMDMLIAQNTQIQREINQIATAVGVVGQWTYNAQLKQFEPPKEK